MVEEDDDMFISTHVKKSSLATPSLYRNPLEQPNLVGAVLLNDKDNAIALSNFEELKKVRCLAKRDN